MKRRIVPAMSGAASVLAAAVVFAQPTDTVQSAGAATPGSAMTLMGASMPCADFARSTAFYAGGLGLAATPGAGPDELVLQFPGGGAVLLCQKPRDGNTPMPARSGPSRVTILVPDLRTLGERLAAAGYALTVPIKVLAQYDVAVAHITDPDGNELELVQRGGVQP